MYPHPKDPNQQQALVDAGLARRHGDRLIPIVRGGSGEDEPSGLSGPFAEFADLADPGQLGDDELAQAIADLDQAVAAVTGNPLEYVSADFTTEQLIDAGRQAVAVLRTLRAAAAERAAAPPAEPVAVTDEEQAALAALAAEAAEPEPPAEPEAEPEPEPAEPVVAAAPPARRSRRLPAPAIEREPAEHQPADRRVALVASGGAPDRQPGERFTSELDLAEAMVARHGQFGRTAPGTVEKFRIARADWGDQYPEERRLGGNILENWATVGRVVDHGAIRREFAARAEAVDRDLNLAASGGLCAPVTPYYNLQYISVPTRPVMGSLPSFLADRGGLRYARPAALSAASDSDAIGLITEAEDRAGGTSAAKSCQVIPCPTFEETDVDIIYHCLQFGNLGARAFPELVSQWNNLVLAAHARLAESNLLTLIDAASTQVTAGAMGLGASSTLFSQILAAANGLRSRNRMDPEAILRLMIPWWAVDLIVSDVIRSQFERFDTDRARVMALLRSFNIEATFYIDSANQREQVFGAQSDGTLLPFPENVVWYLHPEGSFLYLDSGTLELGIVRDSVLNKSNDFQIFGETFESVAFIGVEALAVETRVCDSGTVSLPYAVTCPTDWTQPSN